MRLTRITGLGMCTMAGSTWYEGQTGPVCLISFGRCRGAEERKAGIQRRVAVGGVLTKETKRRPSTTGTSECAMLVRTRRVCKAVPISTALLSASLLSEAEQSSNCSRSTDDGLIEPSKFVLRQSRPSPCVPCLGQPFGRGWRTAWAPDGCEHRSGARQSTAAIAAVRGGMRPQSGQISIDPSPGPLHVRHA